MELEPSKINKNTTKTVRILKGDKYNNCIPYRAFSGYSSLESVQIEDGASIITIGEYAFYCCSSLRSIDIPNTVTAIEQCAFRGCKSLLSIDIPIGVKTIEMYAFDGCLSLKSIDIPIGVTTIGYAAFGGCSSLRSINIPNSVTIIGAGAFRDCKLLQSIHIPNTVKTIGIYAFDGCDTLKQRLKNGTNYHPDTATWLRQRFDNLPVHQACYYANDDAESTVDRLSTLIQENKQALIATDAMGMTPLHILCCNLHITADMVRVLIEREPSLLSQTDVTGSTALQLFLNCRRLVGEDEDDADDDEYEVEYEDEVEVDDEVEESNLNIIPTLRDLLERGIKYDDLTILFVLVKINREIDFTNRDESTNLMPYMSAAASSECGLDVVFALAMENLDNVVV